MKLSPKTIATIVLCSLVILFSVYLIHRHLNPEEGRIDLRLVETRGAVIGEVLAEEMAKVLGNRGNVVGVSIQSSLSDTDPILSSISESFVNTLERFPEIHFLGHRKIETQESMVEESPVSITPQQLIDVRSQYPSADVVVSFGGQPFLNGSEVERYGGNLPKLIVVTNIRDGLRFLFEEDILQLAIVRRTHLGEEVRGSTDTPRAWFERHYEIITKGDATNLP